MKKILKNSVFALAASLAATSLYAAEQESTKKFSIEFRDRERQERQENKAYLARATNRASAYVVFGQDLYRDIDGAGIALDAKASLDTLKFAESAFGNHHDNVFFAAGMRYLSGDGNRSVGTFNQKNDVTYFSLMSSIGYMRDITEESNGFGGHFNVQVYAGLGLGYSAFERERVFIGQARSYTDSGLHINYNSGLVMGINNLPELEMELGFQSLHKGSIMHEFFLRADYNLSSILNAPVSASGRYDMFENALSLGATYHF